MILNKIQILHFLMKLVFLHLFLNLMLLILHYGYYFFSSPFSLSEELITETILCPFLCKNLDLIINEGVQKIQFSFIILFTNIILLLSIF